LNQHKHEQRHGLGRAGDPDWILRSAEPTSSLPRLRELIDAVEQTMPANRHSQANLTAALTVQAINFLCEGIERQQQAPEINRRFGIAIKRAEAWAASSEGSSPTT
jgi:hypothetical protein